MGLLTSFDNGSVGPILGWQDCKYIFPLTYPDTVAVGSKVVDIADERFFIESAIFSKTKKRLAAISTQAIIPYDYGQLTKTSLPEEWQEEINRLQEKTR